MICPDCKQDYDRSYFRLSNYTRQPVGKCRECRNKDSRFYAKKRNAKMKEKVIHEEVVDFGLVNKLYSLMKPNLDYNKKLFR